jgi:hypothetical protein
MFTATNFRIIKLLVLHIYNVFYRKIFGSGSQKSSEVLEEHDVSEFKTELAMQHR